MTTPSHTPPPASGTRGPLRLQLWDSPEPGGVDGEWWPWSRDLQVEAADLVDHFPERINRLLYSRPDWDDQPVGPRGVHKINAARGPVKVGSFPRDDTHLMIATLASGKRVRLKVIPSSTKHGPDSSP